MRNFNPFNFIICFIICFIIDMYSMYQLTVEPYLDSMDQCYKKVIVISPPPIHPALTKISRLVNRTKLSPFKASGTSCPQDQCYYVIQDPRNVCQLLCINHISHLFGYLLQHNFNVNTSFTKIMQKSEVRIPNLICFISKN